MWCGVAFPSSSFPYLTSDMSRGPEAWWLFCATAVALVLLQALGLDSRYAKQLAFVIIASLWIQPEPDILTRASSFGLTSLQYAVTVLFGLCCGRWLLGPQNAVREDGPPGSRPAGKVLLFPCKTIHSRLFPKKHSFDYSYLTVGVPVGVEGVWGGLVSSTSTKRSWFSLSRKAWYHVDPKDYLDRGNGHLGLRGKLDAYLKSQVRADDVRQARFRR